MELDQLTWSEVMQMAVQLGMDFAELRKTDEDPSPTPKLLSAMNKWLESDSKASWEKVVQALKAIKKNALAEKLEEKYCNVPTVLTEEQAQQLIDKAVESGVLKQRNVVGVITGLMESGKTTMLHHLFGMTPPRSYTSTGVAEQSFRSFLNRFVCASPNRPRWGPITYADIREFLAPLIRAGMNETSVDSLAADLMNSSDLQTLPQTFLFGAYSATVSLMTPIVQSITETSYSEDIVMELVHMIDTGGQPELMEVMPSLIHNANLAMVLVDLRYGLNEQPPVSYHEEGVLFKREVPSHYTGRDIILKLVSTFHAKKAIKEAFRILIVATHRDCVGSEKVATLNKELNQLLLPAFENELICYRGRREIAFVLNLKNPNYYDRETLDLIREEIGSSDFVNTFNTPASFFVFEQDLVHCAQKEVKRDILSLNECKDVGARLKMSDEMVEAALVFFHRQNTFLYFRHILPNHVFINPQVPLDIVNKIIRLRYQSLSSSTELLKDGIITKEFLSDISPHFKIGVYEVSNAIELFCHTFILAPLQPETRGQTASAVNLKKKEYLMMCLKPAIPDHELHQYIPKSSDFVPLVVKFSSGCVPLGCFSATISCLLSKYGWEVIRKGATPKCLAQNIASLHDPDLLTNVVLVDCKQYLEVYIDTKLSIRNLPPDICSLVRRKVFCAAEKVLEVMQLDTDCIKISSAFFCVCSEAAEKHFTDFKSHNDEHFLCCECSKYTSMPNDKQLLWIQPASSLAPHHPHQQQSRLHAYPLRPTWWNCSVL